MKTLYIIGGTMGVGKTTTCQHLKKILPDSVFLDGDWCWDSHPFQVTEETRHMVMDNICYLLNNFLRVSAYRNVIFCWVLHEQSIIDYLLSRLNLSGVCVRVISLVCDRESLCARLTKDVASGRREPDVIERSVRRLPLYRGLHTEKLDVSAITAKEAAERIAALP